MKVIFLDFDGVINDWYTMDSINYYNIEILKKIVDETNAKIVVTSSNKYPYQVNNQEYEINKELWCKRYTSALNNKGLEIYDYTSLVNKNRELEILKYLKEHRDIEEFLLLDDDYIIKSLINHQVFLDLYKGLTLEHIEPSLNILNGLLGFYPPDFDIDEDIETRNIRINKYYLKQRNNRGKK